MKDICELIKEVEVEYKQVEEKAFELFCKDELRLRIKLLKDTEKNYHQANKKLNDLTKDALRTLFETDRDCVNGGLVKDKYIKIVQEE